jgi:2-(1,2-epoxy-1,2-dihydrophenyl)acetyl-CoA isomerase
MTDHIRAEVADKVATITLNRPEKMNAFTDEMIAHWIALIEEYRTSAEVHVIVVTGTGRAFSTGGDVSRFDAHAGDTPAGIKGRLRDGIQRLALRLREIDKPVIAAVNGIATGGGVDLAMMCDLRFAARSARFAETYVRMGLLPGAGGAYFLPRLVGAAKALELFWGCEWIGAEEAERIGLVNRVIDDARLMEETLAFARRVAGAAPLSVRLVKTLVYRSLEAEMRDALELAAANLPVVRMSADHKEAVAAHREKRDPLFQGS